MLSYLRPPVLPTHHPHLSHIHHIHWNNTFMNPMNQNPLHKRKRLTVIREGVIPWQPKHNTGHMHCAITQRRWGKRRIRWRGHFKMCCALCVCGGCCVSIPMNDDGDYVGHCFINITYTIGCRLWSCVLRSIIIIYTAVWCVRRAYMLCAWMVDVPSIRWWILTTHQMCTQRSKHTQIFQEKNYIFFY